MIKQYHIIPIALGSALIFLMVACASNFLAVQQHIVKAQSTPPVANTTSGAPGRSPANTTVTQHLPNFNPPITQHCGNKYTSCG